MKHVVTSFFLLLTLTVVSVEKAKAQDFLPLVKDDTEWNIIWQNLSQPPFDCMTESIQLEGDTLVDDMSYKKVMRKISSETQYWNGSTEYYSLYGLIREEPEGKVFYQPIDQDTLFLLYDFGMNVNDTTFMRFCQSSYPLDNVIVRIDSITTQHIAQSDRRVYYVSSKSYNGFPAEWHWTNTWIEGIGAIEGLLYSCHCTNCGGGPKHELLCYHEEGELLYTDPEYDTCVIDNTAVEFAPVGAEWYYERLYNEGGEHTGVTYDRFRSLRTVNINGWECKEIELFQNLDCNGEPNPHTEYRYITQEEKQVFEVENGERYLLYDFGKKVGEWWYAPKYEDTIYVQTVSYTFLMDGSCRNVFITVPTTHENFYFNNIIEGIGMDYSMFPFETSEDPNSCQNGPIRCYTENGVSMIISDTDCDYEILNVDDHAESVLMTVKTMVDGLLHIEFSKALSGAKHIRIIDITGKTVHVSDTHDDFCDIWLADRPMGIYIAEITTNSRIVHVKFVLR